MSAFETLTALAGRVHGTVTEQNGMPIAGARIQAQFNDSDRILTATTGGNGAYELFGGVDGVITVVVLAEGLAYFESSLITQAGEDLQLDVTLGDAHSVVGTVSIENESSARDYVTLFLSRTDGLAGMAWALRVDAAGAFAFNDLAAGSYQLTAVTSGYERFLTAFTLSGIHVLDVELRATGHSVSGTVLTDDTNAPLPFTPVALVDDGGLLARDVTDAHGQFLFEHVREGAARIIIDSLGVHHDESITVGENNNIQLLVSVSQTARSIAVPTGADVPTDGSALSGHSGVDDGWQARGFSTIDLAARTFSDLTTANESGAQSVNPALIPVIQPMERALQSIVETRQRMQWLSLQLVLFLRRPPSATCEIDDEELTALKDWLDEKYLDLRPKRDSLEKYAKELEEWHQSSLKEFRSLVPKISEYLDDLYAGTTLTDLLIPFLETLSVQEIEKFVLTYVPAAQAPHATYEIASVIGKFTSVLEWAKQIESLGINLSETASAWNASLDTLSDEFDEYRNKLGEYAAKLGAYEEDNCICGVAFRNPEPFRLKMGDPPKRGYLSSFVRDIANCPYDPASLRYFALSLPDGFELIDERTGEYEFNPVGCATYVVTFGVRADIFDFSEPSGQLTFIVEGEECVIDPCSGEPISPLEECCVLHESDAAAVVGDCGSYDPNDIIGPSSVGDQRWVRDDVTYDYTIRFENDPEEATASAATVTITQTLDDDLDFSTFRLGDIAFGNTVISAGRGLTSFEHRLDRTADLGIYIDVSAGIDVATGELFFQLKSIDPETGEVPFNPLIGFLPPNDDGVEGQGYVSYSIRPLTAVQTGDVIDATASIIFDQNEAVETPAIFNTIDDGGPTSQVETLAAENVPGFVVQWSGEDDANGSGIRNYDVYVAVNDGPFQVWLNDTTETEAAFVDAIPGNTYAFYCIATDRVGHTEAAPSTADAMTLAVEPVTTSVAEVIVTQSPPFTITVEFTDPMEVQPLIDSGNIRSAVSVVSYKSGPVDLSNWEFSYDDASQVLTLTTEGLLPGGNYEVRLDGSQFLTDTGIVLKGGSAGLEFSIAGFTPTEAIMAGGVDLMVSGYSSPIIVDWNADGLNDLVVGERTDGNQAKIRVYLNNGSNAAPSYDGFSYAQSTAGELAVPAASDFSVVPQVVDWNGDGEVDLLLGLADGRVQLWTNVNTSQLPIFDVPRYLTVGTEPGVTVDELDVGLRAGLDVVDWNNDGKLDVLVGNSTGNIEVFLRSMSEDYDLENGQALQLGAGALIVPTGMASVDAVDLNGDSRKDLVVGNSAGQMFYYPNVGWDSEPKFERVVPLEENGTPIDLPGSPGSRLHVVDYDSDGVLDLVIGTADGTVRVYRGDNAAATVPEEPAIAGGLYKYAFELNGVDDPAGFMVVESGGTTTVDESGSSDALFVVLTSQPASNVVLTIASNDVGEATVAPMTLTFTPDTWDIPQAVIITGVDDPDEDGDQSTLITVAVDVANSDPSYATVPSESIIATTKDDDSIGDPSTDVVYVNDDFTLPDETVIEDADPNTPGNQMAVIGINAFATIQAGLDAVETGGIVFITDDLESDGAGFYAENLMITRSVQLISTESAVGAVMIDGGSAASVVSIQGSTIHVAFSRLVIQNGSAMQGGGIFTTGTLTINDSIVRDNTASETGGGIWNSGTIFLNGTEVLNNTAGISGGGLHNNVSPTRAYIDDSIVDNNSAGQDGGGIWNSGDGLLIVRNGTTISNNTASGDSANQGGGGIFNDGGRLAIWAGVSISGNAANGLEGSGGGILSTGGAAMMFGTVFAHW